MSLRWGLLYRSEARDTWVWEAQGGEVAGAVEGCGESHSRHQEPCWDWDGKPPELKHALSWACASEGCISFHLSSQHPSCCWSFDKSGESKGYNIFLWWDLQLHHKCHLSLNSVGLVFVRWSTPLGLEMDPGHVFVLFISVRFSSDYAGLGEPRWKHNLLHTCSLYSACFTLTSLLTAWGLKLVGVNLLVAISRCLMSRAWSL